MRSGTKLWLAASLAFAAGVAVTIAFERAYAEGGFLRNSLDTALQPPITPTKVLIVVAALLTFAAVPIALAEWRMDRAFARAERGLREARPGDAVEPYAGPEGRGLLFTGRETRALLLEPAGGLGEPRVVELPPEPEPPASEESSTPEPVSGP